VRAWLETWPWSDIAVGMRRTTMSWALLTTTLLLAACGSSDSSDGEAAGAGGISGAGGAGAGGQAGASAGGQAGAGVVGGTAGASAGTGGTEGGAAGAVAAGTAGAGGNDPFAPLDVFCKGTGPLLVTGDGGLQEGQCPGDLASVTFRYALCMCESYTSAGPLMTDAFDSESDGGPVTGSVSGSVGTNGGFTSNGEVSIGGSLWVSGADGVSIIPKATIGAELRCQGPVNGVGTIDVGEDAWINGTTSPTAKLNVAGTLHQPAGAPVSPPCACEPDDVIDVKGFIDKFADKNENALIGLQPGDLSQLVGTKSVTLPCGRYHVDSVGGTGNLTLDVQGRVALFIDGDFTMAGTFTVTLAPGAELDVFIGGNLSASGDFGKGAEKTPAKVRYYMAGDSITMAGGSVFGGNLYGPRATLKLAGSAEVFGALFVKKVEKAGTLTIHYDEAILDGGDCPEGAGGASGAAGAGGGAGAGAGGTGGKPCESCNDCGNQACKEGQCGSCETDTDCCSPLQCRNGVCTTIIN
jgi:hypothetical protein